MVKGEKNYLSMLLHFLANVLRSPEKFCIHSQHVLRSPEKHCKEHKSFAREIKTFKSERESINMHFLIMKHC